MDQKEVLLSVGLELFATQAYASTGIRQIVQKAGIPTGSFHYYFNNKEDFALAVLEYYFEKEVEDNRFNQLLFNPDISAKEKVVVFFTEGFDSHKNKSCKGKISSCVIGSLGQELSSKSEKIAGGIKKLMKKLHFVIQTLIDLGQKDGSIKNSMPSDELAAFLFDAYQGVLIRRKIEQDDKPINDFLSVLDKLL